MKLKVNKKALIASTVALAVIPFTKSHCRNTWRLGSSLSRWNQTWYPTKRWKPTNLYHQIWWYIEFDRRSAWNRCSCVGKLEQHQQHGFDLPRYCFENNSKWSKRVTSVEIQTPQAGATDATVASADLTTNQVTVDDQTVAVNDLSKPVNEDNKAVPVASSSGHSRSSQ